MAKIKLSEIDYVELAESHIEAWKERYWRKSKKEIYFDLSCNHDPSLEIECIEEQIGKPLTDKQRDKVVKKFNKTVIKIIYND